MVKYDVQRYNRQNKRNNIWILISVMIVVILIAVYIIDENKPRNEYLKNIIISKANIVESASENGQYYVRVMTVNSDPGIYLTEDDSWVEVDSSFYLSEGNIGREVGLLLGNYDVFKKNLFSKGQKFEKSVWGIQDIYKTYEAAEQANPYKKYTGDAVLKKKKTTSTGVTYFVVESDQRTFNVEVDKAIYDKYEEKQNVKCEFEALGEFVKVLGVKA